jgi:hypothetical protein
MKRIKFPESYTVQAAPPDDTTYLEGKVYRMNDASALHFTSRGLAVEVEEVEAKPKVEPKAEPKPEAKAEDESDDFAPEKDDDWRGGKVKSSPIVGKRKR